MATFGLTVRAQEYTCPNVLSEGRISHLSEDKLLVLQLPESPFTIMVVNEHALGLYASIHYTGAMTNPEEGQWRIWERAWSSKDWGASIASFCWRPSEETLYVATECVYGSCAIYRLSLREKKSELVLRANPAKNQAVEIAPCSKTRSPLCSVLLDSDTGLIIQEQPLG